MFGVICSVSRLEIEMDLDFDTDRRKRIADLRAAVRVYEARYGELAGMVDLEKARSSLTARRRRLDRLAGEQERIAKQIKSTASEIERIEQWVEFCLEDVVSRARQEHDEGWSPTAVLGYRLWAVGPEHLHGVKMAWLSRKMTATCLTTANRFEVPHSDGRCGRLGCGIYVAKTVDPLYREFDIARIGDVALGLVALTGKVVEHDAGYRGAEAEVIALGASFGRHLLLTADVKHIDEVFADPTVIKREPVVETERHRLLEMETFVEIRARRATQWTLGTSSE